MCIIAVKPKNKKINSKVMELLENCWIWNPDGAGLMMPTNEGVQISKGFMDWEDLESYIEKNEKQLSDNQVVFHFRWATHGKTNQENCHPFPITSDIDLLTSLEVDAKFGMVHNGIISQIAPSKEYSDTLLFVQEYLDDLGDKVLNKKIANFISEMTCSKYVFMSADKMVMAGDFIQAHGMFFSNDGYTTPVYTKTYLTSAFGSDGDSCKSDAFGAELYNGSWVCAFCNQTLGWSEDEVCMDCEEKYSSSVTSYVGGHDDDILDEDDLEELVAQGMFDSVLLDSDAQYPISGRKEAFKGAMLYLEDGREVFI